MKEKQYIRKGECKQCGKCCKIFASLLGNDEASKHVKFTHPKRIINVDGQFIYVIEDPCYFLDKETNLCSINGTKPKLCRIEPSHPKKAIYQHVKSVCGFYFEEVK